MKNIEKYRNLIAKGEVDALLLTSKHNRMYAAEYCVAEGVSVICKEESYYFTDFRYIEAAQKNLPGFTVVMTDADHPYTKLINDAIAAHTVKTLGFEDDSLTVEEYTLYNTKLNAVLHPYSAEINAPRQSKEPWEIEYMKKAQEITDRTFEDLLNVIRPGMTEKELCAELIYRLYKFGSEGPSFDPITISGPNTSLPHGVPSERELQYGDFVTMDFGCLYHGYCSDMTRTIALGYVSEKMDKVYHTVLEAQLAGIAATKAGVTGKAMDAAARKVIDDAGFVGCFGHSYGHSLGLLIHEAPNASMRNDKPMPAGAVVSAEPGIYIPDEFGVRIEDVTVITDNMPAFVMEREHGKGAAFVRTKMKNVVTGAVTETSFNPTAKFEEAFIERKDYEYSYNDGDLYYFMDQETYDMVPVSKEMLDDSFKFIKENTPVKLLSYKGNIFSVETPNFVELTVTKADPGVKGDTATNVTKPATVETGAEIKVPLFINEGEKIQIDTRTGEYLGRVKG